MHILLIPSWYATQKNPTRGQFFLAQARALKNAGHQVGMLVPPSRLRTLHGLQEVRQNWRRKNTDIHISDENGIAIYRIPWWGWIPSVIPSQRGGLGMEVFDRYVREQGKPDILHGHSILYGGYLAACIGLNRNIPSVVTEHNTMFNRHLIQPNQARFIRYTMRTVDRMLAVSASLAEAMRPFGDGRSIAVVGNVVNTNLFSPPATALPETPFIMTSIGQLDSRKSQDSLIDAFAKVFGGKNAQLYLVGDGPRRDEYQRLCQKLTIEPQVVFWGLQPQAEVSRIIQQSHVIVSTSKVETFGVTLIEALACGKPVIATRSGGPEDFIDASNGLTVEVGSQPALEAALAQIHADYHRYDPQAIRQGCIERFSEAAIARQLTTIYESARS